MNTLQKLLKQRETGKAAGIYSCCSANEYVLRAALLRAKQRNVPVLIESTANQVDQFGGYTGMKPADFYAYVTGLAKEIGVPEEQVILGGDHLGPLTFTKYGEKEAMERAHELVRQYVLAGFSKIHLDTSMRVLDDDTSVRLSDEVIARRGAELCQTAEAAWAERCKSVPDAPKPVYIIGSEVPIPGGAQQAEEGVTATLPADLRNTMAVFKEAYASRGLQDAWSRVIGVVVQPGVEFGDEDVFEYDHEKAKNLVAVLPEYPGLVFEGHSTDYQTKYCLRHMVEDGIAILKVGPALTFALREALVALENIERELLGGSGVFMSDFRATLETSMLKNPGSWQKHYHGDGFEQRIARTYSFSDRARYYLPDANVSASVQRLIKNLEGVKIPGTLLSQYMPVQYTKVREGDVENTPTALIIDRIGNCIDEYLYATCPENK